jgi:glycoprotein endo-alpha-1,2-mannosidase
MRAIRGFALFVVALTALVQVGHAVGQPLTVGAYYYAWFGPDSAQWDRGFVRSKLDPPEQPLLGEYDSRNPDVIAQHYAWAHAYGVDVFFASWAGPGSYDDGVIRDDLLPSPARGPTQISILYESLQRLPVGSDDRIHIDAAGVATMVSDFDYLARTYLTQSGYYRIDGRPVVVVYASRIFRGRVAEAIHAVRTHLEAVYGINPYLIGDEMDSDLGPSLARIKLYDAITGYTPYSRTQPPGWPDATGYVLATGQRMQEFRAAAAAAGVGFVPGAQPGFDDLGVRPEQAHHVLSRALAPGDAYDSLFASSLALAGQFVDPSLDLLTITSWNEWNEDTQIEPTAPAAPATGPVAVTQGYPFQSYGTSLLERLAQFKGGWERAWRPTSRGMLHPD